MCVCVCVCDMSDLDSDTKDIAVHDTRTGLNLLTRIYNNSRAPRRLETRGDAFIIPLDY